MKEIKPYTVYVGHDGKKRRTGTIASTADWLMYRKEDKRTISGFSRTKEWSTLGSFEMWSSHEFKEER